MTFMPSALAALATSTPMAPRPITPRVLPWISGPTNWALPFSTSGGTSAPLPLSVFAQVMPSWILRDDISKDAITISFTPLALAPGVLNTTMPRSEHLSSGMLLTPAPARAIAFTEAGMSMLCMSAERSRMASGLTISVADS